MEIWVPYTQVAPATRAALAPYQVWWNDKVNYALMDEDDDYPHFLNKRWDAKRTFLNVEHDVVPWDGALESLWACEEPWCAFAYREDEIYAEDNHTPVFGCCKFSAWFMAATVGVWDAMLDNATDRVRNPSGIDIRGNPKWKLCDGWLRQWAREEGLFVHQHFPAVQNLR
jgi:hypothetical protein